jgi:hypothetical protein
MHPSDTPRNHTHTSKTQSPTLLSQNLISANYRYSTTLSSWISFLHRSKSRSPRTFRLRRGQNLTHGPHAKGTARLMTYLLDGRSTRDSVVTQYCFCCTPHTTASLEARQFLASWLHVVYLKTRSLRCWSNLLDEMVVSPASTDHKGAVRIRDKDVLSKGSKKEWEGRTARRSDLCQQSLRSPTSW